jgi:hypothetical protein
MIIQNINVRREFISYMNNCLENNLSLNEDKVMHFYDKDIVLKDKYRKTILNNNFARNRLIMLHVYDDKNEVNLIYVVNTGCKRLVIEEVIEAKELYRSVVQRSFEYEILTSVYQCV